MTQFWNLGFLITLLLLPFFCSAESSAKIASSIATPDFSKIKNVSQKKKAFFDYLEPYIKQANRDILQERAYIKSLNFNKLSIYQRKQVEQLVSKYRLKYTEITPQTQQTLLKKIDIIPSSLALAQAANESSWGTSRFATQANNFFGQWCFEKGCGLVPLRRPHGKYHEVKKFQSPLLSVKSYMLMLNNHPAFKPLRQLRLKARQQNKPLNGLTLVNGLLPYSAKKQEYVEIIASMIRVNKLAQLDG